MRGSGSTKELAASGRTRLREADGAEVDPIDHAHLLAHAEPPGRHTEGVRLINYEHRARRLRHLRHLRQPCDCAVGVHAVDHDHARPRGKAAPVTEGHANA